MKVSVLPSTTSALALLKCCDVVCCFSISARKNEIQASAAFRDLAVSLEHEIWSEIKRNFLKKIKKFVLNLSLLVVGLYFQITEKKILHLT